MEQEGKIMTGDTYQKLAMRTMNAKDSEKLVESMTGNIGVCIGSLVNGVMGLTGESGEAADIVKKGIFHGKGIDMEHLKKELGDVMWYVALICESCGWELCDVMRTNVDKLKKRYPEGFSEYRANHREEGDI